MINGVNISTNEKELDIKYGLIDFGPERELARAGVKYILTDMNDIRKSYIKLGFHLSEFERMEYYKDFGYASLQEFCDANIGLDKSAVSRCIGVFRTFNASLDSRYRNGTITKGSAMELGTCWKDFSYSQLCEMLSLDEKTRELVKPEMTIKQIRELKKKKNVSQDVSQVATSQPINALDIKKFDNCFGAARQSMIKKAVPIDDIVLNVFDKDGNPVYPCNNVWVDLLGKNGKELIIRLTFSLKNKEE